MVELSWAETARDDTSRSEESVPPVKWEIWSSMCNEYVLTQRLMTSQFSRQLDLPFLPFLLLASRASCTVVIHACCETSLSFRHTCTTISRKGDAQKALHREWLHCLKTFDCLGARLHKRSDFSPDHVQLSSGAVIFFRTWCIRFHVPLRAIFGFERDTLRRPRHRYPRLDIGPKHHSGRPPPRQARSRDEPAMQMCLSKSFNL